MPVQRNRSLAATLVLGLVAGAGVVQLLPDAEPVPQPVVAPSQPIILISDEVPTGPPEPAGVATSTTLPERSTEEGPSFVTRSQLEKELPDSVVELLIERQAILVEEADPDAP